MAGMRIALGCAALLVHGTWIFKSPRVVWTGAGSLYKAENICFLGKASI